MRVELHMEEVFVDIVGYEGLYKISNLGRVMSCPRCRTSVGRGKKYQGHEDKPNFEWHWKSRILKPIDSEGRLQINLHDLGDKQHRLQVAHLVAYHFILNKLPHKVKITRVSFKDGNYHNCSEGNIKVNVKRC